MRQARYHLRRSWIFFVVWLLCAIGHATPGGASSPHVLKDVWVLYQDGHWHVVLIGPASMSYKAIQASNPIRVVVDLPNTLSKTMITSPIRENGILGNVKTTTVVHEPQPLTRVVINLNRDVSYKISRLQEKIWLTFDADSPPTKVESTPGVPGAVKEAEDRPPKTGATQETAATTTLPATQRAPSPPLEGESLPPASKILAIEPITLDAHFGIHIIGDGRLDNYDVSLLFDPPRLVVDLIGVRSSEVKNDLTVSGPWVRKVRIGQHADKVRVVFDLVSKPKTERPYQVVLEKNRLVVSLPQSLDVPAR